MKLFDSPRPLLLGSILAVLPFATGAEDCGSDVWSTLLANKDNTTALRSIEAPPWVSALEFRGTFSILQSCILTLFACIYTALHMNVPSRMDFRSQLVSKSKWMALSLFAPELVLYVAASQLFDALRMRSQLKDLQAKSTTVDKDFDFNLKYCFFFIMGGAYIELSHLAKFMTIVDVDWVFRGHFQKWLGDDPPTTKILLTPMGVLALASDDHWIYFPEGHIDDRSKANIVQKAVVLFQVSWMATTCVARRYYELPITLLEIHTMVHVACAVVLYAFWFQKPHDVFFPEGFYDASWDATLGYMVQITFYPMQVSHMLKYAKGLPDLPEEVEVISLQDQSQGVTMVSNQQILECGIGIDKPGPWSPSLSPQLIARWQAFAARAGDQAVHDPNDWIKIFPQLWWGSFHAEAPKISAPARSPDSGKVVGLGCVLAAMYGGIHLTAWSFEFSTAIERLLWRVACISIIAVGPGLTIAGVSLAAIEDLASVRVNSVMDVMIFIMTTYYFLCRIFIVVEAFVSLRQVPIGVYLTPSWLGMIPHV